MDRVRAFCFLLLVALAAACTALTGVDGLQIEGAAGGPAAGGAGGASSAGGSSPTGDGPSSTSAASTTSAASSTGSTSSTTSAASSTSTSSSSSSSGGAVTWTELQDGVFGPSGTSSCVRNGGCHTNTQSGFKCGTSKSTCYTGIVNAGLVDPGSSASSSSLVVKNVSPLCGSLGGGMPKGGTCVTAAELTEIESWLAAGAPND